jgi:hypothetical protein
MINYFLVEDDIFIDGDALLVTDFINLKIKSAQFFEGGHRDRVCVYKYLHLYYVSKKNKVTLLGG